MCEYLSIDGERLAPDTLAQWRQGKSGIAAELADFLADWYSPPPTMELHTSGSTGKPSVMYAAKEAMRAGARLSCEIFGLRHGSRALLCLPLRYIAGKMMVVRALVSGCELVLCDPCSMPLAKLTEPVDFAPLVPMQAVTTLQQSNGAEQLARARTLLLGGGFIDPALETDLQGVNSHIYASYGMTETLSHIALRRVNGPDRSDLYSPLPGVTVSLSPDSALIISAPHLNIQRLVTHDIAELAADGRFRILGRQGAVINSGGVKIQAEEVEQALRAATRLNLLVLPMPDRVLGQCVALLWEGPAAAEATLQRAISELPAYHRPRLIRHVAELPRTATGKLDRAAATARLHEDAGKTS
ncbi:MAG: AMP-binding protein [Akkermansia sp.]|nr:AMP-binding protein [Akkermansia sp.]